MTTSQPILGERYELGALIGRGGTADVFRAYDRWLQRDVAVKLLREPTELDRERFASEVELMGVLDHPNVVRLLETGVQDDRPWLALELVEGTPLDGVLRDAPLEATRVASIGAQLASALAHAHARAIVHRDVKPANVLIAPRDGAKLTDFGIARRTSSDPLTLTGHTIGTAAYLAPEQVAGEPVSTAADVYALGLVLLEALTGRREYEGPPVEAALVRLQRSPLVPASLPPGWPGLISTMTARLPDARPSASEVVTRLGELGAHLIAADAPLVDPTQEWASAPVRTARRQRTAMALVAAGAAGMFMATTVLLSGGGDESPASASEGPSTSTARKTTSPRTTAATRTPKPSPTPVSNAPATTTTPVAETPGPSATTTTPVAATPRPSATTRTKPPTAPAQQRPARAGKPKKVKGPANSSASRGAKAKRGKKRR